jgi:hypothetical protein
MAALRQAKPVIAQVAKGVKLSAYSLKRTCSPTASARDPDDFGTIFRGGLAVADAHLRGSPVAMLIQR